MSEDKSQNKFECFCGERFEEWEKDLIRFSCRDLNFYKEFNKKSYCVLHYPSQDKSNDFELILREKLEKEDFNFEGVFFPDGFRLFDKEITSEVNFSKSTFSSSIYIRDCVFKNEIRFVDAKFQVNFNFENIIFEKPVSFGEAYFQATDVRFDNIQCKSKANFTGAVFDAWLFVKNCVFKDVSFDACRFIKQSHFESVFSKISVRYATFEDETFFSKSKFGKVNFAESKFQQYTNFREAVFSGQVIFHHSNFQFDTSFEKAVFEESTHFTDAIFDKVANFRQTKFKKYTSFSRICSLNPIPDSETKLMSPINTIDFSNAEFNEITFSFAQFQNILFFRAKFNEDADFWVAKFTQFADFRGSVFNSKANFTRIILGKGAEVKFKDAVFKDYLIFDNSHDLFAHDFSEASLNLQDAKMEKPENCRFHSVSLRPHWFINTDTRKFEFANINWVNADGNARNVKKEIEGFQKEFVNSNLNRLLTITCRQLAHNAEENNRFEEASSFRQMALETERLERKEKRRSWLSGFSHTFKKEINLSNLFSYSGTAIKNSWSLIKTFPSDVLHFLYRTFSGYGERWFRAFCWLIAIWLFWAFLYATPICDFIDKEKYGFAYWIGYSLNVITLQRPEPKPANTFTMIVLGLEVLFAPLQAALLILAVRRKFMR